MAGEDKKHIKKLEELPCALCDAPPPSTAHHSTHGRGMSQRVHDHEAFPLCHRHHMDFHGATGAFREMTHEERTRWQLKMVEFYRPKPPDPTIF